MKIITIEEHFINAEITTANQAEIEKMAPGHANAFMADFGTRQTMKPGQLMDIGAERIADMDAHGIDMQILSYSGTATEVLDLPIAIELAKRANDQMVAAVKAYPDRFRAFANLPICLNSKILSK